MGSAYLQKVGNFEMKSEIPVSLIKWFLDYTNDTRSGISGIYKVMFAPDESFYRILTPFTY